MSWDDVAPTITARFDSFTRGKFGHPDQPEVFPLEKVHCYKLFLWILCLQAIKWILRDRSATQSLRFWQSKLEKV